MQILSAIIVVWKRSEMSLVDENSGIKNVLIVGGGTAGWLTATILASRFYNNPKQSIKIHLVEAPGIPILGVGEGTWPGMRNTLYNAGIKETDFLKFCSASFKQASKFVGWRTGHDDDFYYHPFDSPEIVDGKNLAEYWSDSGTRSSFSSMCCVQETLCEQHLSPKLKTSRDYTGATNYGYHLDAGKFSEFLRKHCIENMGVELTLDRVTSVQPYPNGDVASVVTESSGTLEADLFVDCTGFRSLLLGEHLGVDFIDKSDVFPINSALAVRVPYDAGSPVKSPTISTARKAGWIWDIGLSHRRGIGYVYSDKHVSHEAAQQDLQDYLGVDTFVMQTLSPRRLAIRPGYRKEFWKNNCVAIGLSAGFLEPLEATAMMLIESSANVVADILAKEPGNLQQATKTFNARFQYRWERIIDFLKLHYILSERPEPFWREAASKEGLSERLKNDLLAWRSQTSLREDFDNIDEMFPAASYQYVLYGMGFKPEDNSNSKLVCENNWLQEGFESVSAKAHLLSSKLVSNRDMLDFLKR